MSALLLLLVLSVFNAEQLLLPAHCPMQKETARQTTCHRSRTRSCCPMKQHPCKQKNEPSTPACIDCPLTAVMILQDINQLEPASLLVIKHFSPLLTPALSDYVDRQLKPPNARPLI